jgi:hypothetical protein
MPTTSKYHRTVGPFGNKASDIYDILLAYGVTCPARQHAIKKLLLAGQRGKGNTTQDLAEAKQAIQRAIEIENPLQSGVAAVIHPCKCGSQATLNTANGMVLIQCDNPKCVNVGIPLNSKMNAVRIWNQINPKP